jgi:fibro-slime domain-containing protein
MRPYTGLAAFIFALEGVACGSGDVVASRTSDSGAATGGGGAGSGAAGGGRQGGAGGGAATSGGASGTRDSGQGGNSTPCDGLAATIRDFTEAHPDFEHYVGQGLLGIVEDTLGPDRKPVYAHAGATAYTTGPAEFAQWYNDVPGVNVRIPVEIQFTRQSNGLLTYDDPAFFPIDDRGFGNGPDQRIQPPRNFLFTTEIHTTFTFTGGEIFTFRGDDDLWVFVNGKLAIDLGGVHPVEEATASFDDLAPTLAIVLGNTYSLDIFHAERHTTESNFRIDTSIACFRN